MILDETYFTKEPLLIDGVSASNGYSSNITNQKLIEFRAAIDEFEAEYLQMLLGDDLYDEFVDTYTDVKWNDFKALLFNATTKVSPIANYVYVQYIHRKYVISIGDKAYNLKASDNLVQVPPVARMKAAWRPSIKKNLRLQEYLLENYESLDVSADLDTTNWDLLTEMENMYF